MGKRKTRRTENTKGIWDDDPHEISRPTEMTKIELIRNQLPRKAGKNFSLFYIYFLLKHQGQDFLIQNIAAGDFIRKSYFHVCIFT